MEVNIFFELLILIFHFTLVILILYLLNLNLHHLKRGNKDFHMKYVLVPTDKAANNVVVF